MTFELTCDHLRFFLAPRQLAAFAFEPRRSLGGSTLGLKRLPASLLRCWRFGSSPAFADGGCVPGQLRTFPFFFLDTRQRAVFNVFPHATCHWVAPRSGEPLLRN